MFFFDLASEEPGQDAHARAVLQMANLMTCDDVAMWLCLKSEQQPRCRSGSRGKRAAELPAVFTDFGDKGLDPNTSSA